MKTSKKSQDQFIIQSVLPKSGFSTYETIKVHRAGITAQFSGDSPPPTRRFSSSEVNHWLSQWCMIPPQMGIACSICILVSPSMHAYWSCIVFMVLRAGITAQFSGDSPPTRRFWSPEVNHWLRQWCMIPPQMGIAWSICILVSPSMHAYWSCIVFMVLLGVEFFSSSSYFFVLLSLFHKFFNCAWKVRMAVPPTGIVLFLGIGCNASGVLLCISISLISWCRFEVVRSRSSREHCNNLASLSVCVLQIEMQFL